MTRNSFFSAAALIAAATFATSATAQAQQPTTQPAGGQPTAETQTLWGTAEARGFQEWSRGIQAAGLHERIGDRPFTAFVAADDAYMQVPADQRQQWQTNPMAQQAALGHTLVEGRMTLAELRQREYVTTIDGQRIPVRAEGDVVYLGDARIREGDITAGTGMLHQVDRVIWPGQDHMHHAGQMQPGQMQPGQQAQPGQMQPGQQAQPGQMQPGQQAQPGQMQPGQQQPGQQTQPGQQVQPGQQQPAQQVQPAPAPRPTQQPVMQEPVRERVRKN